MKMDTPVIALSAKPAMSTGKTFFSDFSELRGQKPSSAKSIAALPPATTDIPSVCMNRNIGNAPDWMTHSSTH